MKLLLAVCLTCTLLYEVESLRCHVCDNEECSNTTSVTCPATYTLCQTLTRVSMSSSSSTSTRLYKNCSTLLTCVTPVNQEMEWSLNLGYSKQGFTQICCATDNCNLATLAASNLLPNGKTCPVCSSLNNSLTGMCNDTLYCAGVEDRCFNGTTKINSTEGLQLGCISRNLCGLQVAIQAMLGSDTRITCGAPWSGRISAVLLTLAIAAHRVLA